MDSLASKICELWINAGNQLDLSHMSSTFPWAISWVCIVKIIFRVAWWQLLPAPVGRCPLVILWFLLFCWFCCANKRKTTSPTNYSKNRLYVFAAKGVVLSLPFSACWFHSPRLISSVSLETCSVFQMPIMTKRSWI